MDVKISPQWKAWIGDEFEKPYFAELVRFVKQEYATHQVFPAGRNIFHAFDMCEPDQIKVVMIGQDPYHGVGQAHGLCFSVNEEFRFLRRWSIFFRRFMTMLVLRFRRVEIWIGGRPKVC